MLEGKSATEFEGLFTEIFATIDREISKGITAVEIPGLFATAVNMLVNAIEVACVSGSGSYKKSFVVSGLMAVYVYIDNGPDGDKNRINIPWVPSFIMTALEKQALPFILSTLVEVAVAKFKR